MAAKERIDDMGFGGLSLIQDEEGFRYGIDAVLLADFAAGSTRGHICDLGCGNGILPILPAARVRKIIRQRQKAVEPQEQARIHPERMQLLRDRFHIDGRRAGGTVIVFVLIEAVRLGIFDMELPGLLLQRGIE